MPLMPSSSGMPEPVFHRRLVMLGAIILCLAVASGAFGAHALKTHLRPEALAWWERAVQYQMWHGLAVLGLGLSGLNRVRLSAWLLAAGTLIFSGTLYAMALGAPRWLGAITPIGGLAMIAGWALLAFCAARRDP